jgi:hypothetical protein
MDSAQTQLTEKLTSANNILVTVSRNPSVDQLAACIALSLILNKLNKHATAVFSGEVPSTIEFLEPEETLEKNTDSLRDFIIALDKTKADKLRYKVEDQLVRIFITPYRTSITQKDLDFSQGDFNVDLVVALGVTDQADLDTAITAHGRILHDATLSSINVTGEGGLGNVNWHEPQASSLCELVAKLAKTLGQDLVDEQIATALLTGIVAETARFSNEKTTPQTMSISSELLTFGADQHLVATKLDQPTSPTVTPSQESSDSAPTMSDSSDQHQDTEPTDDQSTPPSKSDDGTIEIAHEDSTPLGETSDAPGAPAPNQDAESPTADDATLTHGESLVNDTTTGTAPQSVVNPMDNALSQGSKLVVDPPLLGGTLTANSRPETLDPSIDPLGIPSGPQSPLMDRAPQGASASLPTTQTPILTGFTPAPPAWVPPSDDALNIAPATSMSATAGAFAQQPIVTEPVMVVEPTQKVTEDTPAQQPADTTIMDARDEVMRALSDAPPPTPEPIQALNAQPLGDALHPVDMPASAPEPIAVPLAPTFADALQQVIPPIVASPTAAVSTPQSMPALAEMPSMSVQPAPAALTVLPSTDADPSSTAPPVPPPIPYRFGNTTNQM